MAVIGEKGKNGEAVRDTVIYITSSYRNEDGELEEHEQVYTIGDYFDRQLDEGRTQYTLIYPISEAPLILSFKHV